MQEVHGGRPHSGDAARSLPADQRLRPAGDQL